MTHFIHIYWNQLHPTLENIYVLLLLLSVLISPWVVAQIARADCYVTRPPSYVTRPPKVCKISTMHATLLSDMFDKCIILLAYKKQDYRFQNNLAKSV